MLRFQHNQKLAVGGAQVEVRHTPGHSPGHVIFYAASDQTVFCGDLIFQHSVGRTDLPGGSHAALLASIRTQVLTLPPETRLLPGHGAETTVGAEAAENPFL
jgi:glyoxylase-like metal-dependent hydrolase (beta-lactamase superfamily II)